MFSRPEIHTAEDARALPHKLRSGRATPQVSHEPGRRHWVRSLFGRALWLDWEQSPNAKSGPFCANLQRSAKPPRHSVRRARSLNAANLEQLYRFRIQHSGEMLESYLPSDCKLTEQPFLKTVQALVSPAAGPGGLAEFEIGADRSPRDPGCARVFCRWARSSITRAPPGSATTRTSACSRA